MTLIDFIKEFPDEESCKSNFKEYRDHLGVVCPKCGCRDHYWKRDNRRYAGEALFNRLLVACVSYKNDFRYKYG